jgi:fatty-acyl-CoA synthase
VPLKNPGEIWVRGPATFSHYWGDPAATADALAEGGWFRTGDIAERDENWDIVVRDRLKNVIISGGENIYAAELERVLNECPLIREAAVVGRPDPKWQEVPVAFVVPADAAALDRDAVLALFEGELARYKHPRDVVFVERLPRNAMGKILHSELRKSLRA